MRFGEQFCVNKALDGQDSNASSPNTSQICQIWVLQQWCTYCKSHEQLFGRDMAFKCLQKSMPSHVNFHGGRLLIVRLEMRYN